MKTLNAISYDIIGCAYKVHSELGPGLLESTYETCLYYELLQMGYSISRQQALPIIYKEQKLDAGYRIDLLVENSIIVELKSVDTIIPIFEAQLLTYLKLAHKKLGLLINFNVCDLKQGIIRKIL
ncbi:MAG TPA: GxxExxY protein [Bacteroidales bacterium]|jgi:GxxExxY protein|nr:GxxExxY protein [Bacteroidales bacterium]